MKHAIKKTVTYSLLALCVALTPAIATAQATVEENAQERINFSGKLRMLSQRIPAATCHIQRGIAADAAANLLTGATAEFEAILTALEVGDPALNIQQPESRRKTLAAIATLRQLWEPLNVAAQSVIAGTATEADITYILTENLAVLGAAQRLVEELVKQYSNPNAVTRASLMLIDISGRQRMLTQKMSKESCMIGTSFETSSTVSDLQTTMRIFEASLEALRFGMDSVGILPPPNATIASGLSGVDADWSSVEPTVVGIIAGEEMDAAAQAAKFNGLNTTMANMNTVVGMYADAAR